ncbi:MAG: hypothetical protein JWN61_2491 [Pseudonocardiales bacterium]|nr:hypothetical protein [Pseudonocardiales bacterium]
MSSITDPQSAAPQDMSTGHAAIAGAGLAAVHIGVLAWRRMRA